jgi:hypothetical protein
MAREIPENEVATMEALVKCGVVMVSIALVYHHRSDRGGLPIAEREAHQRAMARAVLSLERGRDYDDVMGALPKTLR